MSTLKQVAAEGFPEERIQSVLHQIELSQKHVRRPSLPRDVTIEHSLYNHSLSQVTTDFGMSVGHAINYTWIHGADPAEVLSVNKVGYHRSPRISLRYEGPCAHLFC
jgi:Zn-dependent M16 (insulinase) family peptidase